MERKLASVVVIDDLQPIPGADLIEVATVKGWKLVVKKQEFRIGDHAVYCEGNSALSPAGKHVEREGLVIRSTDKRISFKVISNKFLLNEK